MNKKMGAVLIEVSEGLPLNIAETIPCDRAFAHVAPHEIKRLHDQEEP